MNGKSNILDPSSIIHAQEEILYTADGRTLIDLFTAHGTVWLGHRRHEVKQAIIKQLDQVWITGGHPTPVIEDLRNVISSCLPIGYRSASFASTGMEANEQAMRVARVTTGRNGAIGLTGAMHGKSYFTAALAWNNQNGLILPDVHRIPSGPGQNESIMLEMIESRLRSGNIAAVFIEPIHGTSMGWQATINFYRELRTLTSQYETLLIYDEVLTGFYRTGYQFRFLHHEVAPDVIVFGKSCGNGFPAAGVAIREGIPLVQRMLLNSTFSNNALAAAAVTATINFMHKINPTSLVKEIEQTILRELGWAMLNEYPRMCGAGAMWVISMNSAEQGLSLAKELHRRGVCVGHNGYQIRLLPPVTIRNGHLKTACQIISEALLKELELSPDIYKGN
jgi:4-aminobutyrate aminotransferase-like enzyme